MISLGWESIKIHIFQLFWYLNSWKNSWFPIWYFLLILSELSLIWKNHESYEDEDTNFDCTANHSIFIPTITRRRFFRWFTFDLVKMVHSLSTTWPFSESRGDESKDRSHWYLFWINMEYWIPWIVSQTVSNFETPNVCLLSVW